MDDSPADPDHFSLPEPSSSAADADALRRKRKAQGQRACFPCRQRKVRCSYETPCQTCIGRAHPELCTYDAPLKRVHIQPAAPSASDIVETPRPSKPELEIIYGKLETLESVVLGLQKSIGQLSASIDRISSSLDGHSSPRGLPLHVSAGSSSREDHQPAGLYTSNDMTGENVFLGSKSVPAMVMALGKELSSGSGQDGINLQEALGSSVLPVFGLDNETATYPFVDLWGLPHGSPVRIQQLCTMLPSDADCLMYFRYYRDAAYILFPAIVDIDNFESDLTNFLIYRDSDEPQLTADAFGKHEVYGKSIHWLGLLFAALASGSQCSALPRKERQLTSQIYVCCAYECLRIVNYLSHATPIDIQNLLLLGNVISNSMNAGVAWSLLGLTIRLAQSLGLHQGAPASQQPRAAKQRADIWWQIIWQDSLLSISYDRSSPTINISNAQWNALMTQADLSYADAMRSLCGLGLEIVRWRATEHGRKDELLRIVEYRDKIRDILARSTAHLQDLKNCRSMKDRLEYWNFLLHRSYVTGELCRPAVRIKSTKEDLSSSVKQTCLESQADTVEAFLGLQKITKFAIYSWAAVHRALSAALLLGILVERTGNDRVRKLLDQLMLVLTNALSGVETTDLPQPIVRAVEAIQKLIAYQEKRALSRRDSNNESLEETMSNFASSEGNSTPGMFFKDQDENSPNALVQSILWGTHPAPDFSSLYRTSRTL